MGPLGGSEAPNRCFCKPRVSVAKARRPAWAPSPLPVLGPCAPA